MIALAVRPVTVNTLEPDDQQGAWTVSHPLCPNLQHKEKNNSELVTGLPAKSGPGVRVSINDDDAIRGPNAHGNHNRARGPPGRPDGASSPLSRIYNTRKRDISVQMTPRTIRLEFIIVVEVLIMMVMKGGLDGGIPTVGTTIGRQFHAFILGQLVRFR